LKIPNVAYPLVPSLVSSGGHIHRWCGLVGVLQHAFPEF